MDGGKRRRKRRRREQGRTEGVCVQVWDMARWITQPNRQFITVRERERGKAKGRRDVEEKGWGGGLGER